MEENNLGTKATRAEIIETLYERGYIREERMVATDLGFAVVNSLGRYCPSIVSVELTRMLEEKMERIEQSLERRGSVLREAVQELKPILAQLKRVEEALGVELSEAIRAEMLRRRIIGPCPQCGTGRLIILRSRRTGKRFIGCTNFFTGKCNKALPLPQKGSVTPTEKTCKTCNWPIIVYKTAGRRPFQFCINPECPSKAERTRS
jgi:DNA topoisomerase-1